MVERELFPHMDWVVNLRSLVLIKLGSFTTLPAFYFKVRSLLLDELLNWIFSIRRLPLSLVRLWIQDFVSPSNGINIGVTTLPMTSYYVAEDDISDVGFSKVSIDPGELDWLCNGVVVTPDEHFDHLQHLAKFNFGISLDKVYHPRGYLKNLKYARGTCFTSEEDDAQVIYVIILYIII